MKKTEFGFICLIRFVGLVVMGVLGDVDEKVWDPP
jgi:hypothetical protein